ncbi:MAG: outer membrane protein transport protein [Oligoflexia bacterium]|nr:outer membrane protein transport protein [Oligoflexia bacterium]
MKSSCPNACTSRSCLLFLFIFTIGTCWGAGYEKSVYWSARNSALGGATVSAVDGADALYFNPAGLARGAAHEASINISPHNSAVKGPATINNEKKSSDPQWTLPGGILGKYELLDKRLGLGAGFYSAGGVITSFEGVDYSGISSNFSAWKPDLKSNLTLLEFGFGAGYRLSDNLSLGVVWRIGIVRGELASAKVVRSVGGTPIYLTGVAIKDLSEVKFDGAKVGIQYQGDDQKWGMGLVWRSAINFNAEGDSSGAMVMASAARKLDMVGGKAKVANSFPNQITLGGHYKLSDLLALYAAYTWTEYSSNEKLTITGNVTTSTGAVIKISDIEQKWKDMHNLRLGGEWKLSSSWDLRTGYVITSRVTNQDYARVTFYPPGIGHTLIAGAGTKFLNNSMDLDFAAEYSFASNSGKTPDESSSAAYRTPPIAGDFSGRAISMMLSSKYRF